MTGKTIFILVAIAALILSGCGDNMTGNAVVCNKPYIINGNACCLDANDNRVCDNDEQQQAQPAEEQLTPPVKETPAVEEAPEEQATPPGEYTLKVGESVTFEGKIVRLTELGFFQNKLAVTLSVNGVTRELYDTKTPEIIEGLRVEVLKYLNLENSVTIRLEKFELGPNEHLIDTRTAVSLPEPKVKLVDVYEDGAIIIDVIGQTVLDSKIKLNEGESTTVQGITITNIEGFPRTTSGFKLERYALIKIA